MRAGRLRTSTAVAGVAIACVLATGAAAAEGGSWHLVSSFGKGGVAGLPVRERAREQPSQGFASPERFRSLTVPGPHGSLYVGGFAASKRGAFLVARVSAAGTLVKSFGRGGVITVPSVYWFKQAPPRLLALAGGKLLVVGLDHGDQLVAVELGPSGQLIHGFGRAGVAQYALAHAHGFTIITAAVVERDGDILAVYEKELPQPINQPRVPEGQGNGIISYARLLPSGALDHSFGSGGFLAAGGREFALLEGESGTVGACQETLASSGSLLITYEGFAMEELNPSGEALSGFGVQEAIPPAPGPPYLHKNDYHFCDGLFALPGGEIEAASGESLIRLTAAGALDPTFGRGGSANIGSHPEASAVAADGETFSAGDSGGALLLTGTLPSGLPDPKLGARGQRFAVRLARGNDEDRPTWEVLPEGNSVTVRAAEELIRLSG